MREPSPLLDHVLDQASALITLGLSPRAASRVMHLPPPEPLRIDLRGVEALWLQDVAADAPFDKWPSDLGLAGSPGYPPGTTRFVRRNVFTAIFVLDPATVRSH